MNEERIEAFIEKYFRNNQILSIGTGSQGIQFLKQLALKKELEKFNFSVVPTSNQQIIFLHQLKIPIVSLNEKEVDLAVEFVSQADKEFNFIKRNSTSLVRDKMIALSAAEMTAIVDENDFVEKVHGVIPFEIAKYGWKRTLTGLEKLGKINPKQYNQLPPESETGQYVVEVQVDPEYHLDEIEFQAKNIPGVLETGLFIGMADRIVINNASQITVKSRL